MIVRRNRALLVPLLVLATSACTDLWPGPPGPPQNGQLPEGSMTIISSECRVLDEVAGPLKSLLTAANSEGVGLAPERSSFLPPGVQGPPRIESCYRSYDMQVWWRNYYCSIGKCQNAAVPGRSKHGWGRAVDFQDQNGELTFESPGFVWLAEHADEYGFFQPESVRQGSPGEEAWHWEHPGT